MKKLILLLFIILSSCVDKKNTLENKRIKVLKDALSKQKSVTDSLTKNQNNAIAIVDSLQNNIKNNFLNKRVVRSFLKTDMEFIVNDKNLIKTFFDGLFLDHMCFWYSLFNAKMLNDNVYDNNIKDEESFLNYIWVLSDRDEESIKAIFTKQRMSFVYSFFENNNYYEDSGLKNSIEGLLLAYEEIGKNKDILNELYIKSLKNKGSLVIETIISDKMKLLLQEKKYCSYDDTETKSTYSRAFRVYSFWARRHQENNKEIVYELLKDFYKNVHINNLSEGEGNYEEEDYDTGYRTLDGLAIMDYKEPNQTEMDAIVYSSSITKSKSGYDLNELKKKYQNKYPKSKQMKLYNVLSERKGGFDGKKDINYVNSGGWENNSKFTVEIPTHNVYYVYVSSNNIIYQQLIYKDEDFKIHNSDNTISYHFKILEPTRQNTYDDDDIKIIDKKQVVISGRDDNDNKTYSEIFHPNMSEGKYLYFVKVVTKKGNVFFSEIQILNCIRVK